MDKLRCVRACMCVGGGVCCMCVWGGGYVVCVCVGGGVAVGVSLFVTSLCGCEQVVMFLPPSPLIPNTLPIVQ